jgi:dolichol-phosphate mannosyltransferase
MTSKKPYISFIIPAYNESKSIVKVLVETIKVGKKLRKPFEIIVVNDCSSDNTPDLIKKMQKKYKFIRMHSHKINLGIEGSVKDLYRHARGEYAFFNGADGDIDMDVLLKMHQHLKNTSSDIIVGNRISKNYTFKRKLVSYLYNNLVLILTGIPVYDAGTVKLLSRKYYKKQNIKSQSVFADAERLVRAHLAGAKINTIDIIQNNNERNDSINYPQVIMSTVELLKLATEIRLQQLKSILSI